MLMQVISQWRVTKKKLRAEFRNAFTKGFAEVEHRIKTKSGKEIPSLTKGMVVKIEG